MEEIGDENAPECSDDSQVPGADQSFLTVVLTEIDLVLLGWIQCHIVQSP